MPTSFSPRDLQRVALEGFDRLKRYRAAYAMFIREYVGQYYEAEKGTTGQEPLNLIFNTIRAMVPTIVMKNPANDVMTDFVDYRHYAFLLARGLDITQERLRLAQTLRAGLVDAFMGMAIFKIGIAESGQLLYIDDVHVDPGALYCDLVSLENLCLDPTCTDWDGAAFIGDRIRVPRQVLLDTDGYDHDLVRSLPRSGTPRDERGVKTLSQKSTGTTHMEEEMDYVDVVELWVPDANTVVTIPDPATVMTDDYLAIRDYYGPKDGPYERLTLTQPVPHNPLPVAPVSLWIDLHKAGNRMFRKIMEQAERQKDIGIYDPAAIDTAEDIREAADGEMVAGDPRSVNVLSFGGQNQRNEAMMQQLQIWYNYIAGNPDQLAGLASNAETATQAQILQGNATLAVGDMQDMVYDTTANISRKMAWYMHHDPFLELPITIRRTGGEVQQLWLTPEQRRGDFLDYAFRIIPKSMARLDTQVRARRILEFMTNIVPSLANTALMMMQMGQEFNLPVALTKAAEELEIGEWVQELFHDPQFLQRVQFMQQVGPADPGKASRQGQAIRQNGGYPMQHRIVTPAQQQRKESQAGVRESQQNIKAGGFA